MFFSFDKRFLYAILIIMVLRGLAGYFSDPNALIGLLISIPGILIAITFHEYAHAKVADKLGDDTPRRDGRLSLNPLAHLDPVGFIMLLFAGFGWGKPVQVNSRNYNRDISMEKADCLVSLAGPATNFVLAIVFTIIYFVLYKFIGTSYNNAISIIMNMIFYTISINVGLGIFNLIPLPPLDGSKIIKPLLPQKAKYFFEDYEKIFYFGFVILWITGIAGILISPLIKLVLKGLLYLGTFII